MRNDAVAVFLDRPRKEHNVTDEINPEEYLRMEPGLILPSDPLARERAALQAKYGFKPILRDPDFTAVAQAMADRLGGVCGVNHVDEHRNQIFVGIAGAEMEGMTCDQGACSTLITRRTVKGRTAFALNNLQHFPLFASNDMVTKFDLGSYLGAQILPPEGVPIGTVFRVSPEPTPHTQPHLDFMKAQAATVMDILISRAQQ